MSDASSSEVVSEYDRPGRTIVLCFDGTGAEYSTKNTNVVKFFGLLRKGCTEQQVTYYQAGIGTYFASGVVSPLFTKLASILDEAVAWYLDKHVMDGYKFLMNNYRTGDKICLFGFSRGAYTARALAGMLTKVGLLPGGNIQQVNFAYKMYKRTDTEGMKLAAGFKQTFSRDAKVEFVGVWDTVESTGMLVNRQLPFTDNNTDIRVFRHALSLDEHRARFRPNLYHLSTQNGVSERAPTWFDAIVSAISRLFRNEDPRGEYQEVGSGPVPGSIEQSLLSDRSTPNGIQASGEPVTEESIIPQTDVLEVWFSGCHSDIGGGSVQDDVKVSLAQIPLHWMVEQVIQSRCGILFDTEKLTRIGFKFPCHMGGHPTCGVKNAGSSIFYQTSDEAKKPTSDSETYRERSDALAPLFDQLEIHKFWWILEIVPSGYAWQDPKGVWHKHWSINLGKGRLICSERPKFHHTVKERMDYGPLKYKPRAIWDHQEVYV